MKNTKMAATKLRMAMSGLKAAYHDASPADRKVIVATMKEVQAIHNQLVTAAEDDVEEDVEDMEDAAEDDMAEGGDDESADDMAMDEMAEEDAAAGMNMDDAHMSEDDMMDEEEMAVAPADDMAPLSMDDMDMSDMDMSEGEEPIMNVDGLDIPEEFVGDLGDLGLLEMGETTEDEEDVDADEELAVAALALAANALKMLKAESDEEDDMLIMMHETPEDEPESSQEEDASSEAEEHKAMKRGEQLHGSRRQAAVRAQSVKPNDTDLAVRKLREISARLSSVRTPVSALMVDLLGGGSLIVSREELEALGASSDRFLDQAPYTIKKIEDLNDAAEKVQMPLDLYEGAEDSTILGVYNAGGRLKLVAEVKGGKVVQFKGRHNRSPTDEEKLILKAASKSATQGQMFNLSSSAAKPAPRGMREVLAPLARRPTRGR